jgi:hypothetical protein
MMCVTSLRATIIPSHGLQTLSGIPEVNGSWERNGSPEGNGGPGGNSGPGGMVVRGGMVVWRGTASAAESKPDTLGVATPSVQLQFGRASILWIDGFFFTVIMFVA